MRMVRSFSFLGTLIVVAGLVGRVGAQLLVQSAWISVELRLFVCVVHLSGRSWATWSLCELFTDLPR